MNSDLELTSTCCLVLNQEKSVKVSQRCLICDLSTAFFRISAYNASIRLLFLRVIDIATYITADLVKAGQFWKGTVEPSLRILMTLELAPRVAKVFQNWFSLAPTGRF